MATLTAAAWTDPNPKISPQMYNIIANNEKLIKNILKISRIEFENTVKNFQNPEQLKQIVDALIQRGFIDIAANKENLEQYRNNIGRAFELGTNSYQPSTKQMLDIYKEVIQNNEVNYIKNITEKQKEDILRILTDAIQNRQMQPNTIQQISNAAGLNESRAGGITRTSMMRASNAASYAQNHSEGAKYFVVDFRAAACKDCIALYHNRVFNIDEAKYIPPIHPNCACVPMFFNTYEEAEAFAKDISKRNALELKELKKRGFKDIPDDGSGPNINLKKLPEPTVPKKFNKFKNKQEFYNHAEKNLSKQYSDLHSKNRLTSGGMQLERYKNTEWYKHANDYLRGLPVDPNIDIHSLKREIQLMDTVFKGKTIDRDIIVYRHMGPTLHGYKRGDFFIEDGYMSTTCSLKYASELWKKGNREGYVAVIKIPKGSNGLQVETALKGNVKRDEGEWLTSRGSSLNIESIDHNKKWCEMRLFK